MLLFQINPLKKYNASIHISWACFNIVYLSWFLNNLLFSQYAILYRVLWLHLDDVFPLQQVFYPNMLAISYHVLLTLSLVLILTQIFQFLCPINIQTIYIGKILYSTRKIKWYNSTMYHSVLHWNLNTTNNPIKIMEINEVHI